MPSNIPPQTTAPMPLEITVRGFIIGDKEFLVEPLTQTFKEEDLTQIKTLLADKQELPQ